MKLVKKFLLGLVVITTIFALAGCNDLNKLLDDDDDQTDTDQLSGIISGTAGNATIDKANDTTGNLRDIQLLQTKHYGSRAKIIQTNVDETLSHGVQGFVFNVVQHKKDDVVGTRTYDKAMVDFMVISVGYAGGPNYYISAYRNITNPQEVNFGADEVKTKADFLSATDAVEYVIEAQPSLLANQPKVIGKRSSNLPADACKYDEEAKELTVTINVVAEEDGSYTVQFYDPSKVINSKTGGWISSLKLKDIEPSLEKKIGKDITGYTKKTQTYIGVYANVYPYGSNPEFKLTGSWRLSGIKGEAEVAEFED